MIDGAMEHVRQVGIVRGAIREAVSRPGQAHDHTQEDQAMFQHGGTPFSHRDRAGGVWAWRVPVRFSYSIGGTLGPLNRGVMCKNHNFRTKTNALIPWGFPCAKAMCVIGPRRWHDDTRTDMRNSV